MQVAKGVEILHQDKLELCKKATSETDDKKQNDNKKQTASTKQSCQQLDILRRGPQAWAKVYGGDPKESKRALNNVNNFVFGTFHNNIRQYFMAANLTGEDPAKVKYDIHYLRRANRLNFNTSKFIQSSLFGQWTPPKGIQVLSSFPQKTAHALKSITSACPQGCPPGTRQVDTYAAFARLCCWKTCEPCQGRTYSSSPNSSTCKKCGSGRRPNDEHTSCDIVRLSSNTDHAASIVAICFAVIGLTVSTVTIALFYRHRTAFIVKTSDLILSSGMLVFHILSFISVSLLLVEPSRAVCISQLILVLPWPVMYVGCILVKTNRLRVLFRHTTKLSSRKLLLLSNRTQGLYLIFLGVLTSFFLFAWTFFKTPDSHMVFFKDHAELVCYLHNGWMGVYFGFTLSLLIISLLLALLAHNLPADFNEASFLLLSTCGITFLWIILIPAYYFSTRVRSDTLLALIISSQGLMTLFCLFTRRLYYILWPRSDEAMKGRRMLSRSPTQRSRLSYGSRALSSTSLHTTNSDGSRPERDRQETKDSGSAISTKKAQEPKDAPKGNQPVAASAHTPMEIAETVL